MIEFKGDLSENSKNHILKNQSKLYFVVSLFALLLIGSFSLIIAFSCEFMLIFWSTLAILIFLLVILPLVPFIAKQKELKHLVPKKIVIDRECEYIYFYRKFDGYTLCVKFSDVKRIIETIEYFYIKIQFKVGGIICQKDLITEGSIEEFEEIFKGLIIKKDYDKSK